MLRLARTGLFTAVSLLALGAAVPALAQTINPAAPTQESSSNVDDVVVTASRVNRDGFQAPTPTTVLTSEAIERSAPLNVADVINEMPSVRPSLTPASSSSLSSHGGNYLDLRGLGFNRTLVLVDSKRYVNSQVQGGVDIGQIPQALIGGVDIVTGGASAAWGSDAVAGVVNLRLNHSLEGGRATVQAGITDEGDRKNSMFSFAYGRRILDDRGHVIVSGEITDNDGIPTLAYRDWGAQSWGVISNPAYTATNAEPRNLFVPNALYSNMSPGGVINAGPLRGVRFGLNGAPLPFTYGTLVSSTRMQGGSGSDTTSSQMLEPKTARRNAYGRFSYEFSPALSGYVEGSLAEFQYNSGGGQSLASFSIRRDNPFMPGSVGAAMDTNRITTFTMGRSFNENYPGLENQVTATTKRFVAGLDGELPRGWSWDAYYTYGEAENDQQFSHNRLTARFTQAVDAVLNPAMGTIVCRSTAAQAAGCIPLNPFGPTSISKEAYDWAFGSGFRTYSTSQHAAAINVNGEPFSTWAGPVSVATGFEWRRETADQIADARAMNGEFASYGFQPWAGEVEVKEAYGEVVVPLAADQSWAQSLDLNLAARVTDYSTSGSVTTWKVGGTWQVNDQILLRATQSRDIRAPALVDLFGAPGNLYYTVLDPVLAQTYQVQTLTAGNASLVPEEADTFTAGGVFRPSFVPGLKLSLDYYDIELTNAIISLSAASIVERCNSVQPGLCALIDRDPLTKMMNYIRNTPQNLQLLRTSGVDFETAYEMPVLGGDLSLRGLISYVDKTTMDDGVLVVELAGSSNQPTTGGIGGVPHWRYNFSGVWTRGPATLGVQVRHIGGANVNNDYTAKDLNILEHDGQTLVDLTGSYDLEIDGREIEVFGKVGNLLDKDPPLTGNSSYGTTRSLYDVIGRSFTAGLRFRF